MAEIKIPRFKYNPPEEQLTEEMALKAVGELSYQSPVEIVSQNIREKFEGDVMQIIHSYDIHVAKDELVKALQYDRDQYKKGFADGSKLRMDKIKAEVAREIFEEVELFLNKAIDGWKKERRFCYHNRDIEMIDFRNDAFKYCLNEIAELKKKYTEEHG